MTTHRKQDTDNARYFSFWRAAQKVAIALGLLAAATGLITGFLGLLSIFLDISALQDVIIIASSLSAAMVLLSLAAFSAAKDQSKKYVAPKFGYVSYCLVLKHLKRLKVKQPVRYILEHPESVDAYLTVLKASRYKIEAYYKEGKIASVWNAINVWQTGPDIIEEHKVAALVLPTDSELKRVDKILYLIEDRGVTRYEDIAGIVQATDEQPTVLTEGAL